MRSGSDVISPEIINKVGPVVLDALVLRERPTGVGRSVLELIRALAGTERGLDFVVLTTVPGMFDFLAGKKEWQVKECPGAKGGLLRKAFFTQFQVPRLCRQLGAGLLHSLQFVAPLRLDIPEVVTVLDLTWHSYPQTIEQPRLGYYRFLVPRVLERADRILAISEATGTELAAAYPKTADKITVTRFGTPSWVWATRDRFLSGEASRSRSVKSLTGRPYFLFVSTLEPRKNLGGLLQAYEIFLENARTAGRPEGEIPDLHLVGSKGWKDSSLRDLLARLQNDGRLHLLGYQLKDDDLWDKYRLAQGLLFPSLHEGFGFPILEAMAAELPVLTSNRGAMAEVGGDCVLLADPERPREIAAKLEILAWQRAIVDDLRLRGLERAKNWTWERTAQLTSEVYSQIIGC
ncbi:MAG: glycosyltransferase family 4 protein [Gemmatimonadales bacterium]|nr:glycosyltransferase family 4 protein [Gemmatimonadales bacterium]